MIESKNLELKVIDSFFSEEELKYWQNKLTNIQMEPIKNGEKDHYGFRHWVELEDDSLHLKIKNKFFPDKDFETKMACIHLRHNYQKPLIHNDDYKYNFICYLKGPPLFNNGTGFFYGNDLCMHVGFVENRAIFFNGENVLHTDLQALGESSPRYTLNIFYGKT